MECGAAARFHMIECKTGCCIHGDEFFGLYFWVINRGILKIGTNLSENNVGPLSGPHEFIHYLFIVYSATLSPVVTSRLGMVG